MTQGCRLGLHRFPPSPSAATRWHRLPDSLPCLAPRPEHAARSRRPNPLRRHAPILLLYHRTTCTIGCLALAAPRHATTIRVQGHWPRMLCCTTLEDNVEVVEPGLPPPPSIVIGPPPPRHGWRQQRQGGDDAGKGPSGAVGEPSSRSPSF
jgi:hypothetical protein